jgi:predicted dehydrogenase
MTRAVLVGCGGISGSWLGTPTVKKRVEIVGLVDIKRKAAEAKAREFGIEGAFIGTDLEWALHRTRPDVVFDCTVPEAHCRVTLTALAHGCHVLGEKPLADTMANARKMVAAARRARRIYAVIQNRRYQAEIRGLRAFLEAGAIGKVTTVQSNFFIGAHFGGFRDRMRHVLLLDMAIHTFDAARFITGADAKSVYCHEWNPAGSWYDYDAAAVAVFEMTGGIVYTYQGSWCAEGCGTTWEADWRIVGTKGSVLWDGGQAFRAEAPTARKGFIRPVGRLKVPVRAIKRVGHDGVIGEFIDCVTGGGAPETACADNIKSLAMVHSAVESAGARQRVTVRV